MREGVEIWRKREAWGGRVGCGFDLGVLMEKGYTNTLHIHTDEHAHRRLRARTNAPCRAKYAADARCLVFLHFHHLGLVRVQLGILFL